MTDTAKDKARERKRRQREREAAEGKLKIEIKLDAVETELLAKCELLDGGDPSTFYKRALLHGAKFLANAGNRRGGKQRIKNHENPKR